MNRPRVSRAPVPRRQPKHSPPPWFRSDSYEAAASMDAADWLVNLCVRCRLHHEPDPQLEASLRELGPVLRRAEMFPECSIGPNGTARWEALIMHGDAAALAMVEFLDRLAPWDSSTSYGIDEARTHGAVKKGVRPMEVSELYWIEGGLPPDVRTYGVENRPPTRRIHGKAPAAYLGSLDDAIAEGFGSQMLGRCVRIDLSLPDDVLHADLRRYLDDERERLRNLGGPQPYREGAESRRKPSPGTFRALARMRLLPYLDLCRWNSAEHHNLTEHALQEMAGVSAEDRGAELRSYAALFTTPHHLNAWFARAGRSAKVQMRRGRSETVIP